MPTALLLASQGCFFICRIAAFPALSLSDFFTERGKGDSDASPKSSTRGRPKECEREALTEFSASDARVHLRIV